MENKEDRNAQMKMVDEKERKEEEEEEEEEERKIDTFFKLIKTYQEARKRRREEFTGEARKKWNGGERSCVVVPAFLPEDFSECRMDLKPLKEDDTKVKEEAKEEGQEVKGLDLNLAL